MSAVPFQAPRFQKTSFNCPHCLAYANQTWQDMYTFGRTSVPGLAAALCAHCAQWSVWRGGKMIFPVAILVDPPNVDLDQTIKDDYNEAAEIMNRSPRGAAALLRLALQKMCNGQLAASGGDLNAQIKNLVSRGLAVEVQQSLDSLRVIGNEALHPGSIDLKDDLDTAKALFGLVNFIADQMISQPKKIEALFGGKVPVSQKEQIAKRDGIKA